MTEEQFVELQSQHWARFYSICVQYQQVTTMRHSLCCYILLLLTPLKLHAGLYSTPSSVQCLDLNRLNALAMKMWSTHAGSMTVVQQIFICLCHVQACLPRSMIVPSWSNLLGCLDLVSPICLYGSMMFVYLTYLHYQCDQIRTGFFLHYFN